MNAEKEIVCRADIHRDFLVATMISRSGLKLQEQFGMDHDGLLAFRSWILDHRCLRVAVESTGNYWYPIFCILEGHVEFILANAFQIRNIECKKTDRLDSERIAISCLNNLIKPSRIYPKDYQDLRNITRSREALVNARSKLKNQIHQSLAVCCIKLSSLIITSLDHDLQLQAVCTVQAYLQRLVGDTSELSAADGSACEAARLLPSLLPGDSLPGGSASAVILDPQSGQVLAAVGDLGGNNQGSLLASHPAGTTITPFVYLTGFSRGLNPASLTWDVASGTPVVGQVYHGPIRLRIALANDYLPPAQGVLAQMGTESVQNIAASFGLQLPPDLLTQDFNTSPVALAEAYGVFANTGTQAGQSLSGAGLQPAAVLQVSSVDHSVWADWTVPQSQSLLSPQLAYLMNQVLSDETARWPSLGHPNPLEIGRPAGAKISLSLDSSASWTVGYTPQRVTVVHLVGAGTASMPARYSAGLWHALMQYTVRDLPAASWEMPSGVVTLSVCNPSGLLPTAACPDVVSEVFLDGRQPVQADTLYQTFQVNRETGLLATVFTPPELVEPHTYMVLPAMARTWAASAGIDTPPTAYDTLQAPPLLPDVHIISPEMFADGGGTLKVLGSAAGADFVSYRLEYGQGLYPQDWVQIGSDSNIPVTEGSLGTWDTTGLNGLYAMRLMVVRSERRVDQAVVQVTLDNTPPQVAISYPQAAQEISLAQEPQVALQAQVNDPFLVKVEFYVDSIMVGETDTAPFGVVWQAKAGSHTLQVVATDRAGNKSEAKIEFTVN